MTLKKSKHLPFFSDNLKNHLSKTYYQKILTYDLILKQNFSNIMQLPRVDQIILNTTSKNYVNEKKNLVFTLAALELISGQKPQLTYARKSVANFKIRQHQILGCKVLLRENLMYAFLEKFSRILLPHLRDYTQKNQKNFLIRQNQANKSKKLQAYTLGLKNLMIFPELENHFELVEHFRGMNITFILSNCSSKRNFIQTENSANLLLLLSGFQIPYY